MSLLLTLLLSSWRPYDNTTIGNDGIGPFRAGQEIARVKPLLDTTVPQGNDDTYDCAIYPTVDRSVLVMVRKGRVVRAAINGDDRGYVTATGVGLGTTEAILLEAYGKSLLVKQAFDPDQRAYYIPTSGTTSIQFTVSGGYVSEIIAGDRSAVQMPEGCM